MALEKEKENAQIKTRKLKLIFLGKYFANIHMYMLLKYTELMH
jgi:hypothetical protein